MTTGHSVEKLEFLTERAYALSSYARTCVAPTLAAGRVPLFPASPCQDARRVPPDLGC